MENRLSDSISKVEQNLASNSLTAVPSVKAVSTYVSNTPIIAASNAVAYFSNLNTGDLEVFSSVDAALQQLDIENTTTSPNGTLYLNKAADNSLIDYNNTKMILNIINKHDTRIYVELNNADYLKTQGMSGINFSGTIIAKGIGRNLSLNPAFLNGSTFEFSISPDTPPGSVIVFSDFISNVITNPSNINVTIVLKGNSKVYGNSVPNVTITDSTPVVNSDIVYNVANINNVVSSRAVFSAIGKIPVQDFTATTNIATSSDPNNVRKILRVNNTNSTSYYIFSTTDTSLIGDFYIIRQENVGKIYFQPIVDSGLPAPTLTCIGCDNHTTFVGCTLILHRSALDRWVLTPYHSPVKPTLSVGSKAILSGGNYNNSGIYTGISPSDSFPGMEWMDSLYVYKYMSGVNDTDGGYFVWTRIKKQGDILISPDGSQFRLTVDNNGVVSSTKL